MNRVVIYDAALSRMLRGSRGPVAQIVNRKADLIHSFARANIADKTESRTGDLEASLRKIPQEGPDGYRVIVGADAHHRGFPYAKALETGINPLTGEPMRFGAFNPGYMVPAVRQAGFRLRG